MRPNVTDCAMTRLFDALIGGFAQSREPAAGKVARPTTGQDEAVVDDQVDWHHPHLSLMYTVYSDHPIRQTTYPDVF